MALSSIAISTVSLHMLNARLPRQVLVSLVGLLSAVPTASAGPQIAGKAGGGRVPGCETCIYESWPTSLAVDQKAGKTGALGEAIAAPLLLVEDRAAGFSIDGVAGAPGTAVPFTIRLPSQIGEGNTEQSLRFLMFRGVPDDVTLSAGFRTRNTWIVGIKDAGNLQLYIPAGRGKGFALEVLLYRGGSATPEKRTATVEISPAALPTASASVSKDAAPSEPSTRKPPALSKEDEALFDQGSRHLRDGNIAFGRVVFEELAARGSAQGAFAAAQTYDPAVLEQLHVVGIQGDLEKAKYWYRKAAELGGSATIDILSSLRKESPSN